MIYETLFIPQVTYTSTPRQQRSFIIKLQAIAEFTARYELIRCFGWTKKINDVLAYHIIPSGSSWEGPIGQAFPFTDTKEGIKKNEVVSIGGLNKSVSNSDEQVIFPGFKKVLKVFRQALELQCYLEVAGENCLWFTNLEVKHEILELTIFL